DEKTVFIRWDNTGLVIEGHEAWTAQKGTYSLSLEAFIEEVRSFDRRLIAAMHERVQSIQEKWERPQIQIDTKALRREQDERSRWLIEAFERLQNGVQPNWDEVIAAISYFEKQGYPIHVG